jgi:hypothetical protein
LENKLQKTAENGWKLQTTTSRSAHSGIQSTWSTLTSGSAETFCSLARRSWVRTGQTKMNVHIVQDARCRLYDICMHTCVETFAYNIHDINIHLCIIYIYIWVTWHVVYSGKHAV